jgi:hypothetical protein
MNSKDVLDKILTLLSVKKEEVLFTDAKATNGDILQSPTFDLGEGVEVVSEDGTKAPAKDGEYEISLKDESGNENIIRIVVKDGKIEERENVEEAKNAEGEEEMKTEIKKVQPISEDYEPKENEVKFGDDTELPSGDGVEEEVDTIPEDDTESLGSVIEKLSYRITELEKKIASMEMQPTEEIKKEEDVEETKIPKLDGAPVEETKFSLQGGKQSKKSGLEDAQNTFLSKLYN